MLKRILLPFFILFLSIGYSQTDTISIMTYNLLNFPDGSTICGSSNVTVPNRFDTLRKIMGYSQPDIFVVCELQNQKGADSILNRSLNVFGTTHYSPATFHNNAGGASIQNMLYYNSNKLTLLSQDVVLQVTVTLIIIYCTATILIWELF